MDTSQLLLSISQYMHWNIQLLYQEHWFEEIQYTLLKEHSTVSFHAFKIGGWWGCMYFLAYQIKNKYFLRTILHKKTTVVPVHAMKAYRGRSGKTPFILNLGTWRWPFNCTHRQLYTGGKAPGTHWTGGWVDPRACLDVSEYR